MGKMERIPSNTATIRDSVNLLFLMEISVQGEASKF